MSGNPRIGVLPCFHTHPVTGVLTDQRLEAVLTFAQDGLRNSAPSELLAACSQPKAELHTDGSALALRFAMLGCSCPGRACGRSRWLSSTLNSLCAGLCWLMYAAVFMLQHGC